MKLEDIATLAADGWWEINKSITVRDTLVIDRSTRIVGSAWLDVRDSAWLDVRDSAWLDVSDSAWLDVRDSAWLDVRDSARLYVRDSARMYVSGSARMYVSGSARMYVSGSARMYVSGWHELARDTWALLRSPDGLYYAGCRGPFTREQALKHWDREDDRACLFTMAILLCDPK